MARLFRWLSGRELPVRFDLRRCDWQLLDDARFGRAEAPGLSLVEPGGIGANDWLALLSGERTRARACLLGVDDPRERARLLRLGFGEVVDCDISLPELDARLRRVAERDAMVPRVQRVGSLTLDLLCRDGLVAGRRLGLHPREFALLWRLAESPGTPVAPLRLLADVWHLSFRPETNSLAVHVSRLRAKLRLAGLDGLVETAPGGAYRLVVPAARSVPLAPVRAGGLALDAYLLLGEEQTEAEQDQLA